MSEIPSTGTLPRCEHSVYWPVGTPFAWGCGFCSPTAYDGDMQLKFVLPTTDRQMSADPERVLANGKYNSSSCPECHSNIHSVCEKKSKRWICADCGTEFAAPRYFQ